MSFPKMLYQSIIGKWMCRLEGEKVCTCISTNST
jgi:hypothetical protein